MINRQTNKQTKRITTKTTKTTTTKTTITLAVHISAIFDVFEKAGRTDLRTDFLHGTDRRTDSPSDKYGNKTETTEN